MSNYHATSINFKTNCFPQFLKNAFPTEGLDDAAAGGFVGRPVAVTGGDRDAHRAAPQALDGTPVLLQDDPESRWRKVMTHLLFVLNYLPPDGIRQCLPEESTCHLYLRSRKRAYISPIF
jgi:hypothetical protein